MTTVVNELQKLLAGPANLTTDEAVAVAMAIALLDAQAAQPAQVTEGWQLVPVEPTEAMLKAGNKHTWPYPCVYPYKAMLSAAPVTKEQNET